jgi:chaperonin GroES
MSRKIEPLDDRVLIRPTDPDKMTKGGIIIPDNAREKPHEGTVVSVGPGKRAESGERNKIAVEAGDTVVYSKYAGTEIQIDGVAHVVLRETDLICKITEGVPATV